jgi:uncharacterized protein with GYD domain
MIRYIVLLNFTDQGIRNVKQTVERGKAFKAVADKTGAKIKELFWTQGAHDVVGIMEVPDEETCMSLLLSLNSLGNVRSQTLRAFSAEEMSRVLAKIP